MRSLLLILATVLIVQQVSAIQYAPVVRVRSGRVRGVVEHVPHSQSVFLYQGIPYGQAKRFEKPKYAKPWGGVLNGTYYRDACAQPDLERETFGITEKTKTMGEDCLFLNVWRPRPNFVNDVMFGGMIIPMRKVMVYFVGSTSYDRGTIFNQLADAKHLSSHGDVVVVTVQYRVGPFGFLYGGTKDAPGNVGLHDQILALRWIYYNIARFSGDHAQVTIFGQGQTVGSLILSPLNYRLFRYAILQSGSPLSVYGATNKTEALARTTDLATKLDCPISNINATLDCLRNKTTQEILAITKDAFQRNQLFLPIYGDDFLPLKPSKALKDGKFNLYLNLVYGVNKDEGTDFVSMFVPDEVNLTVNSVKESIKWMMIFYGQNYGEEVAEFYTKNLNETATKEEMRSLIATVWADYTVVCPTVLFAEQYARKSPRRYFYSYRLEQPFSIPSTYSDTTVSQGQEAMFLMGGPSDKRFTQADLKLSKNMIYAWTSFAKNGWIRGWYGKIAWARAFEKPLEPVTKYMALNSEDYKMVSGYYSETCNGFWQKHLIGEDGE